MLQQIVSGLRHMLRPQARESLADPVDAIIRLLKEDQPSTRNPPATAMPERPYQIQRRRRRYRDRGDPPQG